MAKKPKPAYYRVWSASDGTVLLALPGPKSPKNPRGPGSDYDEDGCSCHYEWDESVLGYREWAVAVARGAVVNNLNLKKTLRARVENRLDRIEAALAEVVAILRDRDAE